MSPEHIDVTLARLRMPNGSKRKAVLPKLACINSQYATLYWLRSIDVTKISGHYVRPKSLLRVTQI